MRVSPINCVPRTVVRNSMQNKIHETVPQPVENADNTVSFKGMIKWGGTIGSILGTFAGIGVGAVATIVSGGMLAPLLGAAIGCTAGGIGGDMLDAKYNPNYPKDEDEDRPDYNSSDFNINDFIP